MGVVFWYIGVGVSYTEKTSRLIITQLWCGFRKIAETFENFGKELFLVATNHEVAGSNPAGQV